MNKKFDIAATMVLCAALALLVSCTGFFTTSWGGARDPGRMTVTADNVQQLLGNAKGDANASKGILDKIAEMSNPDAAMKTAAVTAARQASGIELELLKNLSDLIDAAQAQDGSGLETIVELLSGAIKDNDLPGISADLTKILGGDNINDEGEFRNPSFLNNVGELDITVLTVTLVLAEVEKSGKDLPTYLADLDVNAPPSPSEEVIVALARVAVNRGTNIGSMLDGFFGGL